jgi:8-oxo-dGTP diphosphatase
MIDEAIQIVAAVAVDAEGRVLLVRKRGTLVFMQPGGKLESEEMPIEALRREIAEELLARFKDAALLGRYQARAANEAGRTVDALLYEVTLEGPIEAAAEIDELVWVDPRAPGTIKLAPLTSDIVFALLLSHMS